MKFKDLPYERLDFDTLVEQLRAGIDAIENAASPQDVLKVLREMDETGKHVDTTYAIAYIRHTLDTTDEFYAAEQEYLDELMPRLNEWTQKLSITMVNSPHREALEKEIGSLYFRNIEIGIKCFDPIIIEDMQEENRLCTEYQKLLASAQIEFDGKTLSLAQLTPYHSDNDRSVRKTSTEARAAWFLSHGERLNSLFEELVQVRTRMARKLGYDNYIELGYNRMQRNCYDKDMVKSFREMVQKHIVPLAAKVKEAQRRRIGVDALTMYDDAFEYPDGNPKPFGTPEQIFEHGKSMYHAMSAETAEFIDFMLESDLFDVLTRPGKAGGGYCYTLQEYGSPFIFANFNGTAGDIDVLTHEAGHAFAAYQGRDIFPSALAHPTSEACEVHSMSMEFFAWPYMEGFFGDQTEKYYSYHLGSALTFLPYGTMVDHFQHIVYENPDMTPEQRNDAWLELEGLYRPWLELADFPFYGEGRRWQAQAHIYERPFYYIDYCLAQTVALQYWSLAQEEYPEAWRRYMKFLNMGGRQTFTELLDTAGMESPFGQEALRTVAQAAAVWLSAREQR